ncbi:ergot alkaloid biosynthesis protein [Phenylobacterium aquaticum]|uniref:ergot alkaloid biosynthesis protein n=1 Tax=Phenylobacterium aquaticum TaxID=1763816 RepID=UPI001F5C74E2|nr:ergot alkaloid biosynthesis protein [Phenylobacterium aquaticum]MCI3131908.1 ergot alkaloid biosynthesis protein [Phenylobacterium aquaticum]
MSVLITGGAGKTGRRLAQRLDARGAAYRVASRAASDDPRTRRFDWTDRATWPAAIEGTRGIYLVPPPGGGDPAAMINFARLALERGAGRIVLLSASLLPAGGPGAGQIHAWLRDHAPDWAVLRPSWFMQNFSEGQHLETIRTEGRIYSATGQGRVAFISADDIASAACAALTAPEPLQAEFVLTGPEALSYDQAAREIGEAAGRRIEHVRLSVEALAARHVAAGLPPMTAQILAGMDALIADGAEDRVTDAVEVLTGAPPMGLAAFCRAAASVWAA